MRGYTAIEFGWTVEKDDAEEDIVLVCNVYPGEAQTWDYPGSGPMVEVIDVYQMVPGVGRVDCSYMVDDFEGNERVYEAALEAADDRDEAAKESADEARWEAKRDRNA